MGDIGKKVEGAAKKAAKGKVAGGKKGSKGSGKAQDKVKKAGKELLK